MPKLNISEAAYLLGVSTDTLRRWEEEGKLIPEQTKGRLFNKSMINRITVTDVPKTIPAQKALFSVRNAKRCQSAFGRRWGDSPVQATLSMRSIVR